LWHLIFKRLRATIIYFAVDFDVYDYEVESNIIPYFSALKTALSQNSDYQAGIYASRSACKKVTNAGHTVASYVCDMSNSMNASNKMIFGDSGTLQPVVSIAKTVEYGLMTVAFKIDDTGNLQVDLQVQLLLAY